MLSAEYLIYHATTRKQYIQRYDPDIGRYQISPRTEGREEGSIVAELDLDDALERAWALAKEQNSEPLLLLINSYALGQQRWTMERGEERRRRKISYRLSYLERKEYGVYSLSEPQQSALRERPRIQVFIQRGGRSKTQRVRK